MPRLLLERFAMGAPGATLPSQFVTSHGVAVILPEPTRIEFVGSGLGLSVATTVRLQLPALTGSLVLNLFVGGTAPIAYLLGADGRGVAPALQLVKAFDQTCRLTYDGPATLGSVQLDFPSGGGVLLELAANLSGRSIALVPERQKTLTITTDLCQGIVYAETGTLQVLSGGASASDLQAARRFVAGVAYKRNGGGVAAPICPSANDLKNPIIKRNWDNCGKAATDAAGDDVKTCDHFVIWYSDDGGVTPSKQPKRIPDDWPYDCAADVQGHWGAFRANIYGTDNFYVIKYCGVP